MENNVLTYEVWSNFNGVNLGLNDKNVLFCLRPFLMRPNECSSTRVFKWFIFRPINAGLLTLGLHSAEFKTFENVSLRDLVSVRASNERFRETLRCVRIAKLFVRPRFSARLRIVSKPPSVHFIALPLLPSVRLLKTHSIVQEISIAHFQTMNGLLKKKKNWRINLFFA